MPRQASAKTKPPARRASELSLMVGRRIYAARRRQGWSLAQLAARSGVHPATIRTYEAGEREIPLRVIPAIAAGLGLPVKVLLGAVLCPGCGEKPPPCPNCGDKPWPGLRCPVCGETGQPRVAEASQ